MQSLAQYSTLGTSYTAAQVKTQFSTNAGQRWRFERLDAGLNILADISTSVDMQKVPPTITHDSTAAVKRSLQMMVRGDLVLNPLSEFIRPVYGLLMPDGGYVEWYLGVFTMLIPDRTISPGWTWVTIKGLDLSQLLVDSKFKVAFAAPSGSTYLSAINTMVRLAGLATPIAVQILDQGFTIPSTLTWDAGNSILAAINDLLQAMNYQPAFFNELGVLTSQPFPDYNAVTPSFTFDTTQGASLMTTPITTRVDMSRALNQVRVMVEDPKRAPFSSYRENTRPDSIVSVTKWHPRLAVFKDSSLVNQAAADARAVLELQRGAWIFTEYTVSSIPWPVSQDLDIYRMSYTATDEGSVSDNFLEIGWKHACGGGGLTEHKLLRLVQV